MYSTQQNTYLGKAIAPHRCLSTKAKLRQMPGYAKAGAISEPGRFLNICIPLVTLVTRPTNGLLPCKLSRSIKPRRRLVSPPPGRAGPRPGSASGPGRGRPPGGRGTGSGRPGQRVPSQQRSSRHSAPPTVSHCRGQPTGSMTQPGGPARHDTQPLAARDRTLTGAQSTSYS